jgi:hypothetical protein
MITPAPPALASPLSIAPLLASKHLWFEQDMKNDALAHLIAAAKALQDSRDLTGDPFLKSVVGGLVVILENVQVHTIHLSMT